MSESSGSKNAVVHIKALSKCEREMEELSADKQQKFENCCITCLAGCIFVNYCGNDAICNVFTHVSLMMIAGIGTCFGSYYMVNTLGMAESQLDEMWAEIGGPVKGLVSFVMGFYIFALLGYRSGYLDQFTIAVQSCNRVLQTMNSIGTIPDEKKATISRYMLAAYACFFAHANDEMDEEGKGKFLQMLVKQGILTGAELGKIEEATEGTFSWCHRIPFSWCNAEIGSCDLSAPQRLALGGLTGKAQDKLEDDPPGDIPLVLQFMINGIVVFCCTMDSITCGLTISENIDNAPKVGMLFATLCFELLFNISLLEFCRQMINNITGEDCLDVDYAAGIASLAREMKVHFKYGQPSDV